MGAFAQQLLENASPSARPQPDERIRPLHRSYVPRAEIFLAERPLSFSLAPWNLPKMIPSLECLFTWTITFIESGRWPPADISHAPSFKISVKLRRPNLADQMRQGFEGQYVHFFE